jgi:predicted N-formylglutamate amidohydrolase
MPDAPLLEVIEGNCVLVILAVHAGRYIPPELYDVTGRPLGVAENGDIQRHIAIDVGIEGVARALAHTTGGHALLATHSRLVADLNRFPDDIEAVAPEADGTEIPMNEHLTEDGRRRRLAQYHEAAHRQIGEYLDKLRARWGEPFVIRLHSFARNLRESPGEPRAQDVCVYNYPELGRDPVFERFLSVLRAQNPALHVGNNAPFSARMPHTPPSKDDPRSPSPVSYFHVIQRANNRSLALEVCNDLLAGGEAQRNMAEVLARALSGAFGFQSAESLDEARGHRVEA